MSRGAYNISGHRSPLVSQERLYADLNLRMTIHPNKNDIIPLTDTDAVKQAVRNIVLTNFGEKLFRPNFGGHITRYLFENVNQFTALAIQTGIEDILRSFERRISNVRVEVIDNSDANEYIVTIHFRLINTTVSQSVSFGLNRLR